MKQFRFRPPSGDVRVLVGAGAWQSLPRLLAGMAPSAIFVVTHKNLERRFRATLEKALGASPPAPLTPLAPLRWLLVPQGEQTKRLDVAERLWRALSAAHADRAAVLLLLGGGVIGDLGGFVAATYLRGIRFLALPTTALAQADSCLGGKTGIDLPLGKNLVGAIWHPSAIVADSEVLQSLDARQWRSGLAEAVKSAAVGDAALFEWMERHAPHLVQGPSRSGEGLLLRALRIKARFVERDERESGARMLLNFGHTLGHAYETITGFGTLAHGEAIAAGMVEETRLAVRIGASSPSVQERLAHLLERLGLPTAPPRIRPSRLLSALRSDKKRYGDRLRLPIVPEVGKAELIELPDHELSRLLLVERSERLKHSENPRRPSPRRPR